MRTIIKLLLPALIVGCQGENTDILSELPEGIKLIDSVTAKSDEIIIPFNKYELDNGLTIVLHKDNSDPLVHVDVTYHVGSGREEIGKSGFAHFFEHMLFQGSKNVEDEQHFSLITESGGTLNGSTNSDRTNYYETVPANQLEKMLWLESDRMGYLLNGPAVTDKAFEVQRETVKNERGQRVDNRPYGLLSERMDEAMYPEGHPYSWSTIGYLEDLDRAQLDDLKRFFLRWYGPNNATLTIGGDINEIETLEWIKKYFSPIPSGPEVTKPVYNQVTIDKNRYISLEDKNARIPLIFMSWPTVHGNHPDEAPLDVLQDIIGGGETSLLYKNLQKPGIAIQSSAGHPCGEISCTFNIFALANPQRNLNLKEIEINIRNSLEEFESRGVNEDDLIRVKSSIVAGIVYGLESVSGKVTQLAAYETYRSDPNGITEDIQRYENVTKKDVIRVYNEYIKNKPSVIMSIVPEGQKDKAAGSDTWKRYTRNIPEDMKSEEFNWSPPEDNFDRSVVPSAGPNPKVKTPTVYTSDINGIPLLGSINSEVPTTTISVRIKSGQSNESLDKLGLASLTATMMNESTKQLSIENISNELAKLGASYSWSSGDTYTILNIRSLSKNADQTIKLAINSLLEPKFDEKDFLRNKNNVIQNLKQSKKQPSTTASEVFNKLLYGTNNSFSYSSSGTEKTVPSITLDDVVNFYTANYSPKIASIIAVSNLEKTELVKLLAPLNQWVGGDVPKPEIKPFPTIKGKAVYFVDQPGAPQSEIRIGQRALAYDAKGEYFRSGIMNYMLGGAFNSRINLNLREDKGYTYGARSFFNGNEHYGYYRAGAGVRADSTAASLNEFMKEMNEYRNNGITDSELKFTKSAIGQSDARAYETPSQKLGFLSRMMTYDLDPSFVDEQANILKKIDVVEINDLARKYLNTDEMITVIVGDKKKYMSEIKNLGYSVIEIDADGAAIDINKTN